MCKTLFHLQMRQIHGPFHSPMLFLASSLLCSVPVFFLKHRYGLSSFLSKEDCLNDLRFIQGTLQLGQSAFDLFSGHRPL